MKVLDMFSGIGGFSLAARWAGMETVAFCEMDRFCQSTLKKHWPGVPVYDDARTMSYDGPVDVVTSGDPCQRDSRANTGRDGESMWPFTLHQIRTHRPVWVLRENVSGNIDTGTLVRVEGDLRAEGYKCRSYHLSALSFGAAQHRHRTWTLAYTDGARFKERDDAAESGAPERRQHTLHVGPHGVYWMGTESPVLRRTDDVPRRVDRIKALGNAIVPEIAFQFLKHMAKAA